MDMALEGYVSAIGSVQPFVSILVLMDMALEVMPYLPMERMFQVSILVLMDMALEE